MQLKYINPNEYGSLMYDDEEKNNLINVINSRRIFRYSKTNYDFVTESENKVKATFNAPYALAISNGTSGLITALRAIDVHPGDRVLIGSYTFLAASLAVIHLGGIPIPLDIDLINGIDIDDLSNELKKGCKAVIATHFQGRCFNLRKVKDIIAKNNKKIYLIEDACQAFGARYKKTYSGCFGDIGVYSFQQYKQVSCGEGGMIVTKQKKLYDNMRNYSDMGSVRNHFPTWDADEAMFGQNYRMNQLIGAVLIAQLNKLNKMINSQHHIRDQIMAALNKYKVKNIINSSDPKGDTGMNILIFLNDGIDENEVINISKERNIELRKMWSNIYYENKLFKKNKLTALDLKNKDCIKTKNIISRMFVISIPPILNASDKEAITNLIIELKSKNYIC
jgi:8-amino-3,8-dideoxy-alpha-D-manno-octulosonate transaminase